MQFRKSPLKAMALLALHLFCQCLKRPLSTTRRNSNESKVEWPSSRVPCCPGWPQRTRNWIVSGEEGEHEAWQKAKNWATLGFTNKCLEAEEESRDTEKKVTRLSFSVSSLPNVLRQAKNTRVQDAAEAAKKKCRTRRRAVCRETKNAYD